MESKKEEEQKKIQKKISIIGAGPVGLYAAYLFSQDESNDVTVYEKRTKDKYNIRPQVLYLATKHNDDYSAFNLTEQHKKHIRGIVPDLDSDKLEECNSKTKTDISTFEEKMNSSSCGYPDAINNTGTLQYNHRLPIDINFRSSVLFNAKMKKEMENIISKIVSGQVLEGEVLKQYSDFDSIYRRYLKDTVPSRLVSFSIYQNTEDSALGGGAKLFDIEINIIVGCYINNNEEEFSKWEQWKDAIEKLLTSEKIKFMLSESSVFSSKMRNIDKNISLFDLTFKAEDQTETSVTPEPSKLLGVGCKKPDSNVVTLKHRTISIFNLQDSLYDLCKEKNNITIKFGINLISQLESNGSFLPKSDFIIVSTGTHNIYSDRDETELLKSMNRTKKTPIYKDLPLNDPTPQNYGMTVHIPCSFLKNYETIDSKTSYIDKQHRWRLFPQYDSEGISNYCTKKLSADDRNNSSNNNKNYAYYLGINLTKSEFNSYKKKDNDVVTYGGRYKISDISDEYELQKDQLINFIKMILTMNNISYNDELNWGNLKISTFMIDLTYVDTKEESVDINDNTPNIFYKENITILDDLLDRNNLGTLPQVNKTNIENIGTDLELHKPPHPHSNIVRSLQLINNFFDTFCIETFERDDVYNILNINVLKNRSSSDIGSGGGGGDNIDEEMVMSTFRDLLRSNDPGAVAIHGEFRRSGDRDAFQAAMTDLVVAHITQNKILILKELFMMSDKALFAIAFKVIGPSREVANVEFATMSDFANRFDITVSKTMQLEDVFYELDKYFPSLDDRKKERILNEIYEHPVYKFAIKVKNMKKEMQHMENRRATTNEDTPLEQATPLVFVGDSLIKVHFFSGSGINIGLMTVYILYLLYRYKKDIEGKEGKDLKFDEIAQFYSRIFESRFFENRKQDLNLIEELLRPSAKIAWESQDLWDEWDRNKTQVTFNDLKSKYTHLLNLHTEHESTRDEEIICKLLEHIKTFYLPDYNKNTENGKFHFAGVSKSDKHISCDDKSTLTNKFKRFVSKPRFTRKKMKKMDAGKKRRKKTRKS